MTVLTLRQAAAEIGVHYDTLRKGWAELVAQHGFPRPFLRLKWDADAVAAWKQARSLPAPAAPPAPTPAQDNRRAARDRAALQQLRNA